MMSKCARERGLKRGKVLEGIESHRRMRVLDNFDHAETWKPILNSYFHCEKNYSRLWINAKVKVLDRLQFAFSEHYDIIYTSCTDHNTSCAVTKLNDLKRSAMLITFFRQPEKDK